MTFIDISPVCFGNFFNWFKLYWQYCEQRKILYSTFDVFIKTEGIYKCL